MTKSNTEKTLNEMIAAVINAGLMSDASVMLSCPNIIRYLFSSIPDTDTPREEDISIA